MVRCFLLAIVLAMPACGSDITAVALNDRHVVVDTLQEPGSVDKLDVLVDLDTSGSMSDNVSEVGTGIAALAQSIDELTLDFQIGFITSDLGDPDFVGPYTTYDPIALTVAPDLLDGTGTEAGFASSYIFITDPLKKYDTDLSNDVYDPFIREDADLLLFLISDEEEQSSITVDQYNDWLNTLKTGGTRVDVVSIVATTEDCADPVGQKYIDLMTARGKDALDLCADNWADWLNESTFLLSLQTTVKLTQSPIESSIVVYVDPDGDDLAFSPEETSDWTFSSDKNEIDLSFTPDYGSTVIVAYDALDQ